MEDQDKLIKKNYLLFHFLLEKTIEELQRASLRVQDHLLALKDYGNPLKLFKWLKKNSFRLVSNHFSITDRKRFELKTPILKVKSNTVQYRQRLANAVTFSRSCVVHALNSKNGPCHSLHASV